MDDEFQEHNSEEKTHEFTGAIISVKIVELSRKIRELSSCLEKEKYKSAQLSERLKMLEADTDKTHGNQDARKNKDSKSSSEQKLLLTHLKSYQDRLSKAEEMISTLRDKNNTLNQDLNLAKKVLECETGESLNFKTWWKRLQSSTSDPGQDISGGWRGRHQQIILLKDRLRSLECKLKQVRHMREFTPNNDMDIPEDFTGATDIDPTKFTPSIFANTLERPSNFIHEKVPEVPKRSQRILQLEKENDSMKQQISELEGKLERMKTRERHDNTQISQLKDKLSKMLEKNNHDEELVQSLVQIQNGLKESLNGEKKKSAALREEYQKLSDSLAAMESKLKAEITQLTEIANQKEEKVMNLEKRLSSLEPSVKDEDRTETDDETLRNGSSKEVALLLMERNSLRDMVSVLNQRLNRSSEVCRQLQRELKLSEQQANDSSKKGPTKRNPSSLTFEKEQTVEDWLQKIIERNSTNDSPEPVRTNLAQSTKKEFIKALKRAREEIISLKTTNEELIQEKQEEFSEFMSLLDEMRQMQVA